MINNYLKLFVFIFCAFSTANSFSENRNSITISPENRCSEYNKKKQYPYSQSVEDKIVHSMNGLVYSPYTGRYFDTDTETDIEHIVSTSEGHDSGLCAASEETRKSFASDPLNLTLASPKINRCGKGGKCGFDAGEWMPEKNRCWFASRVVKVKMKYSLSMDQREAKSLYSVLSKCKSNEMIYFPNKELN